MTHLRFLKKYRVPFLVVLVLFLVSHLLEEEPSPKQSGHSVVDQKNPKLEKSVEESKTSLSKLSDKASSNVSSAPLPESVTNYQFSREVKEIQRLSKELPQSKPQIFQIVNQVDYFKANKVLVKPHTRNGKIQNKMGAVKVLALKSLLVNQKDTDVVRRDLDYIIQQAKDPTIVKIASAAKDSLDQGRSFFDDFVEGVAGLPL